MAPLRQRYLQDLELRNYSPKTQEVYVECVSLFARHFRKSPDLLGREDIRTYQLYLANEKNFEVGAEAAVGQIDPGGLAQGVVSVGGPDRRFGEA